jgi:L-ribulose-5-phosphate 3-epimerase UlaE
MKALGKEINSFWNDFVQNSDYEFVSDDADIQLSDFHKKDVLCLEESKKYDLNAFGFFLIGEKEYTFQTLFKKWQKTCTCKAIVIEIPIEKVEEVTATLKNLFPFVKGLN